jgi:hypothetical protein
VGWPDLAQNKDQWISLVKLRFPQKFRSPYVAIKLEASKERFSSMELVISYIHTPL